MPIIRVVPLFAFVCAFALSACGGVVGPSQNTVEEFSGFVDPLGNGDQHDFTVSKNGEFEVRFTAMQPSTDIILQVAVGQYIGGACLQPISLGFGRVNQVASFGAIVTGRYCVLVFDEGLITERVTYTVRVSHP